MAKLAALFFPIALVINLISEPAPKVEPASKKLPVQKKVEIQVAPIPPESQVSREEEKKELVPEFPIPDWECGTESKSNFGSMITYGDYRWLPRLRVIRDKRSISIRPEMITMGRITRIQDNTDKEKPGKWEFCKQKGIHFTFNDLFFRQTGTTCDYEFWARIQERDGKPFLNIEGGMATCGEEKMQLAGFVTNEGKALPKIR